MSAALQVPQQIFAEPVTVRSVQTSPFSPRLKIKMRLWKLIQGTIFRWSPGFLRGFRRMLLRCFGASVASTASIHNRARVECPWNLVMEAYASLGEEAWAYNLDQISLESYACIGQRCTLLTGTHDVTDPRFPLVTKPIRIAYGAWLAYGVTVLPGVHIGRLSVVGASSVVTKDLPEQMICAGNPCRLIRKRELKAP